jgi:hypothetical protein
MSTIPKTPPRYPSDDDLYLAVLPLVHYSRFFSGERFEEVMTLLPNRNFATEFKPNEVDQYIDTFKSAAEEKYGGPVRRFKYDKFPADEGRVIVVVTPL